MKTAAGDRPPASARRGWNDDRGAGYLAAFIVLFGVLTAAGVGILVDTARMVSVDRKCAAIALEAARAGANAIDTDSVRGGVVAIDAAAAQAQAFDAAAAFVAGSGAELTSVVVTDGEVRVTVAATVDPWFPVMATRVVGASAAAVPTVGTGS